MRVGNGIRIVMLAMLLAACEQAAPAATDGSPQASAAPDAVKVAFVKDLSVPDADEHALPALQATRLAFRQATFRDVSAVPIELEEFDLARDAERLGTIDADPSYVGVIVAPGVNGDRLPPGLDLPMVSLSGLGAGGDAWLRMVAPLSTVVDSLAARLRPRTCILSEDPPPDPLFDLLSGRLPEARATTIDPTDAALVAREARCHVVVWTGGPDAGAEAVRVLHPAGIPVVGGDRLLDPDFLASAGSSAEGAFALCACGNVSTSTELAARRFIQDYQSEHGIAPGAFAVEAWDAAHVILRALSDGDLTRTALERSLDAVTTIDGIEGIRRFAPDGEPLEPSSLLRLYRVEGGRWVGSGWDEVMHVG